MSPSNSPEPSHLSVLINTTPLATGHAGRGIGTYTRLLTQELEHMPNLQVYRSTDPMAEKVKISVVHYPFFDLFFPTLPVTLLKPTVVTIHDVIPLRYPEHYPPGIRGAVNLKRQQLALKTVSAVLTDSHSSKKDIIEFLGVPEQKIHVVYLAANPELEAQKNTIVTKVKKRHQLPEKYVLYVGDINYNKNIPQLIKMVKYLPPDVHLVCVGKNFVEDDIPEWQWIETQLALSDVGNKVHFLTNILTDSTKELAALYSGAVCYVQPSLWEGFGLPVLEAMQCRTPVVSSNQSSLPEVGGEHALYAEPTAESLSEKVLEILGWSKTKRVQETRAAYSWSQTFSWQKTAVETLQMYQTLIK